MSGRTAIVLGATGLVGSELWPKLVGRDSPWESVVLLARRPLAALPAGISCRVIDFDGLPETFPEDIRGDDLFCCLGTTLRQAGSREAFRRVDHDYVLEIARILTQRGLRQMLVVTALGSDPDSRFFYNRVKGQLEADLSNLDIPVISFLRPSLLLGERSDSRPLERLGQAAATPARGLMRGPLATLAPIPAAEVAEAMYRIASHEVNERPVQPGIRRAVIPSSEIARIAHTTDLQSLGGMK